ncbi:trypsin-like peptidase domain-containing protein [Pseudomonas nitroreducens]|uniref:trypsin-like peptidase domain-containing protein n=1 Tax=Pseudomonas nitroreducens TaxID=46680 RepID=UPI002D7FEDF6|nr:trypsin-like peptidase domain-containing protein [Pseudomonas nitroreducens]
MQVQSISDQLFFTTVRIDISTAGGGQGSGTGFIFSHVIGGIEHRVIVTNKHVALGGQQGTFSFLTMKDGQPHLGNGFVIAFDQQAWQSMWFGHPDPDVDIAMTALPPILDSVKQHSGQELYFRAIPSTAIPTAEQALEVDSLVSVTFAGYPNGVWDSKNLLPVIRRGSTATPLDIDFENTPRFIIDASVFGGSSGSPVFIHEQGSFATRSGDMVVGSRFFFIGVIAAVFFRTEENRVISQPIPTHTQPMVQNREMLDLGIVFKARTVVETLEALVRAAQ